MGPMMKNNVEKKERQVQRQLVSVEIVTRVCSSTLRILFIFVTVYIYLRPKLIHKWIPKRVY